jgi:hypothetical protein
MAICNSKIESQNRKKALRLSLRSRKRPIDGHLAGLLTYASNKPEAPSRDLPSGMLLRFSALTVAGQWRILTALPITRRKKTYMRVAGKVKGLGN